MPRQQNRNPQQRPIRPEPRPRVWPGRLLLVVILVLVGTVFWQRQAISDWIQLYGYEPPTRIAALADQTTMTAGAEHLFYLNRPVVASKTEFASFCTNPEQTIVLGCYHSGQDGIYILSIANTSELNGVMQVTAAHEMLHAAYDRLSPDEKLRINKLLQTYYDSVLKNAAIKAEIDAYRKTEPGQLLNEMHSIFGTEVANLPAELESYYVQYFTNRRAVVTQAGSYQAAFRKREAAVAAYDAQLSNLQAKISHNKALLTAQGKDLLAARARLDASKSSGDIASYNAAVPAYNSAVHTYNALLETTKQQIAQFNAIVSKRNTLVVEEQALVKQLSGEALPGAQ